jgi:hypothetical protein
VESVRDLRLMVESGGAEYIRTDSSGVVWFKCRESGKVLSLYAFTLRTPDDVKLALKQQVKDFAAIGED